MKMVENNMISLNGELCGWPACSRVCLAFLHTFTYVKHSFPCTGPWLESHTNIISGVDLATGKPVVVKLLLVHEHMLKQAAAAQERAVTDLHLEDPPVPLVPTKVRWLF
jgi:hypothetical protein